MFIFAWILSLCNENRVFWSRGYHVCFYPILRRKCLYTLKYWSIYVKLHTPQSLSDSQKYFLLYNAIKKCANIKKSCVWWHFVINVVSILAKLCICHLYFYMLILKEITLPLLFTIFCIYLTLWSLNVLRCFN